MWKNSSILSEKEIKASFKGCLIQLLTNLHSQELKDSYFAELSSKNEPVASASNSGGTKLTNSSGDGKEVIQPPKSSKSKLKLKKKGGDEDPFVSDHEDNDKDGDSSKTILASASTKRTKSNDDQMEEVERSKRKKTVR